MLKKSLFWAEQPSLAEKKFHTLNFKWKRVEPFSNVVELKRQINKNKFFLEGKVTQSKPYKCSTGEA